MAACPHRCTPSHSWAHCLLVCTSGRCHQVLCGGRKRLGCAAVGSQMGSPLLWAGGAQCWWRCPSPWGVWTGSCMYFISAKGIHTNKSTGVVYTHTCQDLQRTVCQRRRQSPLPHRLGFQLEKHSMQTITPQGTATPATDNADCGSPPAENTPFPGITRYHYPRSTIIIPLSR